MDTNAANLADYSARAGKKPSRGGLPNVMYVLAAAADLPAELHSRADAITINFAWGSLLRGIVLAEPDLLLSIASIAKPSATLDIIINTLAFQPPVPLELHSLPQPTVEYICTELKPRYAEFGINIQQATMMCKDEMLAVSSDWAQRLAHGRTPQAVHIRAVVKKR